MIHSYMVELFNLKWGGSIAELERDGFGEEFESVIAESPEGSLVGFMLSDLSLLVPRE